MNSTTTIDTAELRRLASGTTPGLYAHRPGQYDDYGLFVTAACNQAIPLCDALDAATQRADAAEAKIAEVEAQAAAMYEAMLPLGQMAAMYAACEDQFKLMEDGVVFHENPGWCITVGHIRALRNAISGTAGRDLLARHAAELAELQSQVPRWIPVSERLPVLGETVLLHHEAGLVETGFRCQQRTYVLDRADANDGMVIVEPIHWQPMPEPPKENQ